MEDNNVPILDKSFIKEKDRCNIDKLLIADLESDNNDIRNADIDSLFNESDCLSDLISSLNNNDKKHHELNYSNPTSNELNIFDSCESRYKLRPPFFRNITKTNCEMSNDENKKLTDKIIMYYKGALVKNKGAEDSNLDELSIREEDKGYDPLKNLYNFIFNLSSSNIHFNNVNINVRVVNNENINNFNQVDAYSEGSQDSFLFFEQLNFGNDNFPDFKMLNKNMRKFHNLHPVLIYI